MSTRAPFPIEEPTFHTEAESSQPLTGRHALVIDAGDAANAGAPGPVRWLELARPGLEIGRRPTGEGGLHTWAVSHRRASGRHARITFQADNWFITDLGSTNGTLVNGRLITGPVRLNDGMFLMFGGQAAVFRLVDASDLAAMTEEAESPLGPVPSASPRMVRMLSRLRRLAPSHEEVLLVGETGVGKEVYARALHAASGRKGPFVPINCAAVPGELLESELFGYVRGAHSQAGQAKKGLIEEASGGTLLLDEIGDMPSAAQAKILRFIQTRQFTPLGATTSRRLDTRFVAATSQTMFDAVVAEMGPALRSDLLGRLGGEPIRLPPLRERPEDLGPLVAHLLASSGGAGMEIEPAAFLALWLYAWPRNVRELEKVIREARLYAVNDARIGLAHLPQSMSGHVRSVPSPAPPAPAQTLDDSDDNGEAGRKLRRPMPTKDELQSLLVQHKGSVSSVARALDRQWAVVHRTLMRYGLDPNTYRDNT
ncbi:MAG: sigma 54-interacting transcriptional regulator [Deltaproteobacteria bacterium]|nr:sigma 54-interacting transcriptional regulator [Deltaproteobacteria bacterium]